MRNDQKLRGPSFSTNVRVADQDTKAIRDNVNRLVTQFNSRTKKVFDSPWGNELLEYLKGQAASSLYAHQGDFEDAYEAALDSDTGSAPSKVTHALKVAEREMADLTKAADRAVRTYLSTHSKAIYMDSQGHQADPTYYMIEDFVGHAAEFFKAFDMLAKHAEKVFSVMKAVKAESPRGFDAVRNIRNTVTSYQKGILDLEGFLRSAGPTTRSAIKDGAQKIIRHLSDAGITAWFPDWDEWVAPKDFDTAVKLMDGTKTASTMAMRVAHRFSRRGRDL